MAVKPLKRSAKPILSGASVSRADITMADIVKAMAEKPIEHPQGHTLIELVVQTGIHCRKLQTAIRKAMAEGLVYSGSATRVDIHGKLRRTQVLFASRAHKPTPNKPLRNRPPNARRGGS